jgi:hypothetical protein
MVDIIIFEATKKALLTQVYVLFTVLKLHFKTVNITYTCAEDSATGC